MLSDVRFSERMQQVKLTQREKKIAAYLEENQDQFLNDTITEFAEKVGVSDATVVRFCRHIGYKGYQDFKMHAARDMLPKERQYNPVLERDDEPATICNKIFNSEVSVLSRTLLGISVPMLEEIAERLQAAERIVLFGTGGSLNVAKDAVHKFLKIGIMVHVYEDMDLQHMASSLMREGDLAIVISHSGSNLSALKCLENAKAGGAFTVAMTGYSRNPIAKAADRTVQIASEQTMYQSESVSTRIAQLAVIDALVALAAFRDYDASYEAIEATRRATSDTKF
jgi:DNA-binding MurR/RpiR family transcriptional regulator